MKGHVEWTRAAIRVAAVAMVLAVAPLFFTSQPAQAFSSCAPQLNSACINESGAYAHKKCGSQATGCVTCCSASGWICYEGEESIANYKDEGCSGDPE